MENVEKYKDTFLNALLKGNRHVCQQLMQEFRASNPSIKILYEEIFKVSLYDIGDLWENNKIGVAIEHMASAIVEGLMNELFSEIMSLERVNKKIIISCVEKEEHQIGGKMVADIFEKNGWDACYLGANTPINELVEFCDLVNPDLIGLSLSVMDNFQSLLKEITELRTITKIPILVGGQALQRAGVQLSEEFADLFYLENLKSVENYLKGV